MPALAVPARLDSWVTRSECRGAGVVHHQRVRSRSGCPELHIVARERRVDGESDRARRRFARRWWRCLRCRRLSGRCRGWRGSRARVPPPTAASNATEPVPALMLSGSAPSTVPLKTTAAFASLTATGPVASVTGLMKVIAPLAGAALEPTLPLTVMPPGAVKVMGPATARPVLGRLRVSPVTLSAVKFELVADLVQTGDGSGDAREGVERQVLRAADRRAEADGAAVGEYADRTAGDRQAAVEGSCRRSR